MTLGKASFTMHLCLALSASVLASCGSDTPAFQERAMTALLEKQQSMPDNVADDSSESSADATVASSAEVEAIEATSYAAEQLPSSEEENELTVEVKESQLRFGSQTTNITSSIAGESTDEVTYTVSAPAGKDPGSVINGNTYVSPQNGSEPYEVTIVAVSKSDPSKSSSTVLKLEPATQVFAGCTNDSKGFPIKADVFSIAANSQKLPDFSKLDKTILTACMEAFQIPVRAWSDGFPGYPNLIEWFAVRATSRLMVNQSGKYEFKLNADDGAKLYIDGALVVDNDGLHAPRAVVGSVNLAQGQHDLVIEYFQGPRYHIALELFWKTPGSNAYTYVPAAAFKP